MRISWLLWLLCEICCSLLSAADWHVGTTGTAAGDGSAAKPWDLGTALTATTKLQPGDTIWLRGGRYHWDDRSRWELQFSGTAAAPITVRSAPGELAILDTWLGGTSPDVGWVRVFGSNLVIRDIRFTCSSTRPRTSTVGGSSPWSTNPVAGGPVDPQSFRGSVSARGANDLFINCRFDNLNEGIAHQWQSPGGGCYGCQSDNNGWTAPDRDHGHGIYGQQAEAGKIWDENLTFLNYSHGLHFYGQNAPISFVTAKGNVSFANRERDILYGGGTAVKQLSVTEHFTGPGSTVMVGYTDPTWTTQNLDGVLMGCVFPSTRLTIGSWQALVQKGNSAPTNGTWVYVRPNKYETGRAHVIAYALSGEQSVTADLSSVLATGTKYEIRRVWQLDGPPLLSGTYSGPITLPMVDSLAPVPISSGEQPKTMPGNFGVFLVRSPGAGPITPPPPPPPPPTGIAIVEPAEGVTLVISQTYQFKGTGESLVWKLDVSGASNPAPFTGPTFQYKIPPGETAVGVTKIIATLTGAGGSVSRTYAVSKTPVDPPPPPPPTDVQVLSLVIRDNKLVFKVMGKEWVLAQ